VVPAPRWAWDRAKVHPHLTLNGIKEYRTQFRQELSRHGEGRCLDCIEIDAVGNWRIHFFPLNQEAIPILGNAAERLSGVAWGMGEAAGFDPKEFVYAPETKSLSEVAGLSGCAGVKSRREEALCVERRGLGDEGRGAVCEGPLRGSD
jgi:hypothetical protein